MNKRFFKYSSRFMAVVMATAMFTSCKKEAFTEADALNLELQRLRVEDSIRRARQSQDLSDRMALARYQRTLDSLDKANAGGQVFYTVAVVDGSTSVFGSGRTEEGKGLAGLTVTVSQYGKARTSTGDQASNGIYTFSDLRSGEVTVTISGGAGNTSITPVNYVANLTPDNAVPNNSTVYVGNVIPVFFNGTDATRMATVRGNVYIERDLTNDVEDPLLPADLGTATNPTVVTATIDVAPRGGRNYFHERYLNSSNDEGANNQGNATRTGAIRRFSYENALARGPLTVTGTGATAVSSYSMLVPSTAVGLPIQINVSEVALDRRSYRINPATGAGRVVTERYLYGPNVMSTAVPIGAGLPTVSFQAFTTAATVSAVYTPAGATSSLAAPITNGGAASGLYLTAPRVVIGAPATGGTQAVGTATLASAAATGAPANTAIRQVTGFSLSNAGSGYTGNAAVSLVRTDTATIGYGTQQGVSASGSILNYIHILNGGFGFVPTTATTVSGSGQFTNYLPTVNFTADAAGTPFVPSVANPATASVLLDIPARYQNGGVISVGNPSGVGTVAEIRVGSTGAGYPTLPFVTFNYGEGQTVAGSTVTDPTTTPATTADLFVTSGTGGINFNASYPTTSGALAGASLTATSITFPSNNATGAGLGRRLVYVPIVSDVRSAGYTTAAGTFTFTPATFVATVDANATSSTFGKVIRIDIVNPGQYFNSQGKAQGLDFLDANANQSIDLLITPTNNANTLSAARTFATGSGLGNYVITDLTFANGLLSNVSSVSSNSNLNFDPITNATLTVNDYVRGNTFLVVFGDPTQSPNVRAYGVPVFSNGMTSAITGVRILSAGSGYSLANNARTPMYLVPNPWFGVGTGTATYGSTNVTFPGSTNNIFGVLNGTAGTASVGHNGTDGFVAGFATRTVSTARLDFVITNPGAGYAVAPSVIAYQGDLSLNAQTTSTINAAGQVTRVAPLTGTAVPAFDATQPVTAQVVDRISSALNTEFRNAGGRVIVANGAVIGIDLGNLAAYTTQVQTNNAPRVTINSSTGTGATATATIGTDPGNAATFRRISGITVTAGGTGYTAGNQWQRDYTRPDNGFQAFGIVGGNSGMSTAGQTNMNFDVFTGLTYVRDIHYGTGQQLD